LSFLAVRWLLLYTVLFIMQILIHALSLFFASLVDLEHWQCSASWLCYHSLSRRLQPTMKLSILGPFTAEPRKWAILKTRRQGKSAKAGEWESVASDELIRSSSSSQAHLDAIITTYPLFTQPQHSKGWRLAHSRLDQRWE
jgi:hypothetical protein